MAQDELGAAIRQDLALDDGVAFVAGRLLADPLGHAPAPFQRDGLPAAGLRRAVGRVHDRVHDVAVVERLAGLAAGLDGPEHVGEHVRVAELGHLVAHREQPAPRRFELLGDVSRTAAGDVHLVAGAQEVVQPDGPLGAGDLVAKVHSAAERPADLELAERSRLEADQAYGVVLGLDRVHQGVRPAHHLHRAVSLPGEGPDDLDAVASEIDDGAPARLAGVPEPRAMRAGMRLPRSDPGHVADGPAAHRGGRLQRLRGVDEVFEVAGEHAGRFDGVEDPLRLRRVAGERLGAQDRLAGGGGEGDRLLVEEVGKSDDDGVRVGVLDGRLHRRGVVRDVPAAGERLAALLGPRVRHRHPVAAPPVVEGHGVEVPDEARPQHRHRSSSHALSPFESISIRDDSMLRHCVTRSASGSSSTGYSPMIRVYAAATARMMPPKRIWRAASGICSTVSSVVRTVRMSAPTMLPA